MCQSRNRLRGHDWGNQAGTLDLRLYKGFLRWRRCPEGRAANGDLGSRAQKWPAVDLLQVRCVLIPSNLALPSTISGSGKRGGYISISGILN